MRRQNAQSAGSPILGLFGNGLGPLPSLFFIPCTFAQWQDVLFELTLHPFTLMFAFNTWSLYLLRLQAAPVMHSGLGHPLCSGHSPGPGMAKADDCCFTNKRELLFL